MSGSQPVTFTSPPVMAPAMMNVPASMRSGMMRCFAPCSLLTPCTRMVDVPAPSIFAPILFSSVGEIDDLGFARAILHNGFAVGQRRGHQQIFGAGDGDLVEDDFGRLEAIGCGFDVAVVLRDLRAQALQALDVQINGPSSNGASAGQRDARRPQRATSGPSTSVEARMVLTSSYDASGLVSVRQEIVVR